MTEAEWLTCTRPGQMLGFRRGKIGDRKLRLYAVGCCRRIWHLLSDERSRRAVEAGELLADGRFSAAAAVQIGNAAAEVSSGVGGIPEAVGWRAARAAEHVVPLPEESWLLGTVWDMVAAAMEGEQLVKEGATPEMLDAWSEHSVESEGAVGWTSIDHDAALAELLRCVFGNPFRPVACDPVWCTSDAVGLARGIYEERAFDRLPLLADALMDAGCADEQVIGHCRSEGPHVRGCRVVDLALGRE